MYTKLTTVALSLLLTLKSSSQITLAKGFSCVLSSAHAREDYFSNGTFRFHSDAYGREVEDPTLLKDYVSDSYSGQLSFKKTKDGLYWGTGLIGSTYKYVIIIPEAYRVVTLSASKAGPQFSNHSTWLLQQVRINRSAGKDYYFINYKGAYCRS
jgi:hypothetical protein